MRAARFHRYGDPDVLSVEEAAEPHAVANSVRIRVHAASVNPIDYLLRGGALQEALPLDLPAIPGRDAAGLVDEVGEGVSNVRVGDLVFGLGGVSDTTAEFAVLTAWSAVPSTWSAEQGAAAGLASATAATRDRRARGSDRSDTADRGRFRRRRKRCNGFRAWPRGLG